jgi:hypothetical protein
MPTRPEPRCPIRIGEPCSLCFPGAAGPENCGLVYLVQSDVELRDQLAAKRLAHRTGSPPNVTPGLRVLRR